MKSRQFGRSLLLILIGYAVFGQAPATHAQSTNSWTSTAVDIPTGFGGFWDVAGNWSLGAPAITHSAILITNTVTKFVQFDDFVPAASATISNLVISAPATFFNTLNLTNVNSGPYQLRVLNSVTLGSGGKLSINTNATLSIEAPPGAGLSIDGEVSVREASLLLVTNSFTFVGRYGIGKMTVDGATAKLSTTIVGLTSNSVGTLTVASGGMFSSPAGLGAGGLAGSTGTIWVTGGQLDVTNGFIGVEVGSTITLSNGTINAANALSKESITLAGGTMTVPNSVIIGGVSNHTGSLIVTGGNLLADSTASNVVFVGATGPGVMTVSAGAARTCYAFVGAAPNSAGTLTVGGGSASVSSNLLLGSFGCTETGVVSVTSGALTVTNAAFNAVLEVRSGTFTASGGSVIIDRLVITNSCGRFIHAGSSLSILQRNLAPGMDADGDGLPNDWEDLYGLNPLSPAGNDGAAGDADGDGLTNAQEFSIGSNPVDPTSPFRISAIQREGDDIRVTWSTAGGTTNMLQVSPGADGGSYSNNFADLPPQLITIGAGILTTNRVEAGGATNSPARYYRIRLVP